MNNVIKNILGLSLILGILVLGYSSFVFVGSYDKGIEPSSFRSFWVSADGKSVTVPDIAQMSFSVLTEGSTDVGVLQQNNSEKMNQVIAFLKNNQVKDPDIQTQFYNINPRYTNCRYDSEFPCPPPEIVGYSVNQSVLVKIRDFDTISDIMTGVVNAGANTVSNLSFTIDDPTEVENEARDEAIIKAQEKAASIARSGGFSLGRLLEIDESYSQPYFNQPQRDFAVSDAMMEKSSIAPSIEAGSQEVVVTMRLKYEIE